MEKIIKAATRTIEVLFQDWVSEDEAREVLKGFGLSPQRLVGRFDRSIILNVVVPADELKEWTEKLEKSRYILTTYIQAQAVRDWQS